MTLLEEDAPFEGMNDNDYKIYNMAIDRIISLLNNKLK